MKIDWYGHSCLRVMTGGSAILIDPLLKSNPTFESCRIVRGRAFREGCGIEMPTNSLPK